MNSTLSPTQRHIALTLSLHMDRDGGSCYPSLGLLAHETGLSRSTVIRSLKAIERAGLLDRQPGGYSKGDSDPHPTQYQARLKGGTRDTHKPKERVSPTPLKGVTHDTRGRPLGRNGGGDLKAAPPVFDPERHERQVALLKEAK